MEAELRWGSTGPRGPRGRSGASTIGHGAAQARQKASDASAGTALNSWSWPRLREPQIEASWCQLVEQADGHSNSAGNVNSLAPGRWQIMHHMDRSSLHMAGELSC